MFRYAWFSGLMVALAVCFGAGGGVSATAGEAHGSPDTVLNSHAAPSLDVAQNAYAAEVNAYFGRGVTPENNVVTAVYEAFGPHPENANLPPAYFEALGIAPPPEEGHYFDRAPDGNSEEFIRQMDRAMEKPWKRDEAPMVVGWIDENSAPVKKLTDALNRPYWYSPMVPPATVDGRKGTLAEVLLPAVQELRSVARFLACRSMLHAGEGRHEEAMQDSFLIFQLGRRSAEGSCVIEYLVGCAIQSIAANNTLVLLQNHCYSSDELERITTAYDQLSPVPPMLAQVTIAEKAMLRELVDMMAEGNYDVVGLYTNDTVSAPEKVLLGFVDYGIVRQRTTNAFNELAVLFGEKNLRARATAVLAMRETMQNNAEVGVASVVRNYLQERSIAGTFSGIVSDVVVSQIVFPIAQSQSAASRSYVRAELFRTLFALEAYQRAHGEYPSSLSDLTPSFLAQPAIDPCSGEEFRYSRTDAGFRIYSFGENCRDDEGRTFGDSPNGDDIVAKISRTK